MVDSSVITYMILLLFLFSTLLQTKGTGFLFGNGWIMTAAHNFQKDDRDDDKTHSLIDQAEFSFFVGEQTFKFSGRERMAFIHHLEPGEYTDYRNKDIAMVKLGHQYEYGRNHESDFEEWEIVERKRLEKMEAYRWEFVKLELPGVQVNQSVQAVHFGGNNKEKKFVTSRVTEISDGNSGRVPLLHLHNPGSATVECPFPSGSSGCPVLTENGGEFLLVGLLFSGDADETKPNGEAEALPWSPAIYQYIDNGVRLIRDIGGYMANRGRAAGERQIQANEEAIQYRARLIQTAQENNLTVYLYNGEVLK